MATSGSTDFTVTRDEIITEALELLGVLGEGGTPNANQITSLSRTLNMMIKNWQADGLNLFAVQRQYLFLEKGVREYTLGPTTEHHFTESFRQTTTNGPATTGSNTVVLTDITGLLVNDYIGLGSGTDVEWNRVSSIDTITNTITLTNNITIDISSSGIVYYYTTKGNRPMKIVNGYISIGANILSTDITLDHISREEYITFSNKDAAGVATQFYYDPQIDSGSLFPWPTTNDERNYYTLYVQRSLDDFDAADNTPDYPQEWYMPLAYNLAMHAAPKYSIPNNEYYIIERQAVALYDMAKDFDEELYTSLRFSPESIRNQG